MSRLHLLHALSVLEVETGVDTNVQKRNFNDQDYTKHWWFPNTGSRPKSGSPKSSKIKGKVYCSPWAFGKTKKKKKKKPRKLQEYGKILMP